MASIQVRSKVVIKKDDKDFVELMNSVSKFLSNYSVDHSTSDYSNRVEISMEWD
ncbi:hypothetical protein [Bacillus cereus]|uniref:hypothetical protein n=1 Tax=Bacillus cereus TaxID=1396 RepID=UPI0015959C0D|nr:hypothetical protein [Bacillus cereus]